MKRYSSSLFIFRRDLRLTDNTALVEALSFSERVTTCFIIDPRQTYQNSYRSDSALQFMVESLIDLQDQLSQKKGRLNILAGLAHEVVARLLAQKAYQALFLNLDYTPFSRKRDADLAAVCQHQGIAFHALHDALLAPPGTIMTQGETPYIKFTPFLRAARKMEIVAPRAPQRSSGYSSESLDESMPVDQLMEHLQVPYNDHLFSKGGTKAALKIVKDLKVFAAYEQERNQPAHHGTTGLSAHLKFGTVSVREVHQAVVDQLGWHSLLITQLWWRDFFTHILFHVPRVLGHAFYEQYDALEWQNAHFTAWCEGRTGFPIVDAGMRQLNSTGWMHNRVRMIVASFLVKDLRIDWRKGEKYFAQKLVDYDPAVNNGNWQWAASTGCDAQPYFRIFNPWLQQKKFDPACEYIKRWIPELADCDARTIHGLAAVHPKGLRYPVPVVDHAEQARVTKSWMRAVQAGGRGKPLKGKS